MTGAMSSGAALAALLGPTSAAEFAAEVWSRRHLLRRAGEGADLTGLVTLSDVDRLLGAHALRTPFLRIAKDGVVAPAGSYTRSGGVGATVGDQVDADRVTDLLAEGSTVVLQGLHRAWPPVQELVTGLTVDLGHPVQANAYLTPAAARGFEPHYDTHDVFVVQLSGTKHWVVHPPAVDVRAGIEEWTNHRAEVAAATGGPPAFDGRLGPGDVLYLPRGWIHAARTDDELSLHLTLGIHPYTARHVLDAAVAEALAGLRVHDALPVGVDLADPDAIADVLEQVNRALVGALAAVKAETVARRLADRRGRDVRPAPLRPTAQLAAATGPPVTVVLRAGFTPRVQPGPRGVTLVLDDRSLTFPATHADAVQVVVSGVEVPPGPIGSLDADASQELVRRLLLAGVVVPLSS